MHLVSLRESCFSVFGGQRPSFPDFLLSHSNYLCLVLLQGCSANRGSRFPQLCFTISQPPAVYWPDKNFYYSSTHPKCVELVMDSRGLWNCQYLIERKKGRKIWPERYFWQTGHLFRWSKSLIDLWLKNHRRHPIWSSIIRESLFKMCCFTMGICP